MTPTPFLKSLRSQRSKIRQGIARNASSDSAAFAYRKRTRSFPGARAITSSRPVENGIGKGSDPTQLKSIGAL
jgi:hypothetical protein